VEEFFTTPDVAFPLNADATAAGLAPVFDWRYSAATPTTCGVAIDVPLIVLVAVLLVYHADVMPLPAAKMSTHGP